MKKKIAPALLAAVLLLLCLAGCLANDPPAAPAHEGTWYFAQNAVECRIGEGKIYEDDLHNKKGQSLRGVYVEKDGYIEANLAGVGGVHILRELYVVQTDAGEVLRDSADETVYFYRDALAALEALEAAQAGLAPTPNDETRLFVPGSQEPTALAPSSDEPLPGSAPSSEESQPSETQSTSEVKANGNMVWVPQSGSRYHSTSGCSGMKNPSQITRAEAESRGYTPCKRCY